MLNGELLMSSSADTCPRRGKNANRTTERDFVTAPMTKFDRMNLVE